jgi:hypothetical protein
MKTQKTQNEIPGNEYSKFKDWVSNNKGMLAMSKVKAFELRQQNQILLEQSKNNVESSKNYWSNGRGRVKSDFGTEIFDALAFNEAQKKIKIIKKSDRFTLGSFFEFAPASDILERETVTFVQKENETRFYSQYINGKNHFTLDSTCSDVLGVFDAGSRARREEQRVKDLDLTAFGEKGGEKKSDEGSESDSDGEDMFGDAKVDLAGVKFNTNPGGVSAMHQSMIDDLGDDIAVEDAENEQLKKDMNSYKGNLMTNMDIIMEDGKGEYMECFPAGDAMEVEHGTKDYLELKGGGGAGGPQLGKRGKMGAKGQWKIIEKRIKKK